MLLSPPSRGGGQVTIDSEAGWSGRGGSMRRTRAGVVMDPDVALTLSAVWGAVRVISETVALLPWQVFMRQQGARKRVYGPTEQLLNFRPNPWMSAYDFRRAMTACALMWGNGYAEIVRDKAGNPVALWPVHPETVIPKIGTDGGLYYQQRTKSGGPVMLKAGDVFHVKGLTVDGIQGVSAITHAAESFGLSLAAQDYGSESFGNGAQPGVVLSQPTGTKAMSPEARTEMLESFERRFGPGNRFRVMHVDSGMDVKTVGMPAKDAQFLETRSFQVLEVCRWFRLTPHKLQHLADATYTNVEQLGTDFAVDTILPWARPLEQEADFKLLGSRGGGLYSRMNLGMLMRGDAAARSSYYNSGITNGWLSPNEARRLEDMDPYEGGDTYFIQGAMVPVDQVGQAPAPVPTNGGSTTARALGAVMDRMISREGQRAQDAGMRMRRAEFCDWLDRFLDQHGGHMRRSLQDAADAEGFPSERARAEIVSFVQAHLQESRALLLDAFDVGRVSNWCDEVERASNKAARLAERLAETRLLAMEGAT